MRKFESTLTGSTILFILVLFLVIPAFSQSLDDVVEDHDSTGLPVVDQPAGAKEAPAADSPATSDGDVESMRAKIVGLAKPEIGKVSGSKGDDGFKVGWDRFLQYYQVAYKLTDIEKQRPDWVKTLKAPGKKINEWCGIFTVWAWKCAGMPVSWNTRVVGCKYRSDVKNIQAGDICIIKKSLNPWNHHCLVASREGDAIETVDGNQSNQQILPHSRKITDIELFYSVSDGLGSPLPKAPGGNGGPKGGSTPTPGKTAPGGGSSSGSDVPGGPPGGSAAHQKALDDFMKDLREIMDSLFSLFK